MQAVFRARDYAYLLLLSSWHCTVDVLLCNAMSKIQLGVMM